MWVVERDGGIEEGNLGYEEEEAREGEQSLGMREKKLGDKRKG